MRLGPTDVLIGELVAKILAEPHAHKWTIQGFGMLRTYLKGNTRLTLWNRIGKVPQVSMVHTHPWHFDSYVVAGRVVNTRYVEHTDEVRGMPFMRQVIKAGEGGGLEDEPREVTLGVDCIDYVVAGETYRQTKDEIHRSDPVDGTITLCKRTVPDGNSPDHAYVYWPADYNWVSAEPRVATREEIDIYVACAEAQLRTAQGWEK
jgi:hypothetical protein